MPIVPPGPLSGSSPLQLGLLPQRERAASTRPVPGAGGAEGASTGSSFADTVAGAVQHVIDVQGRADVLARQAATGELESVQDYMIAATEAQLTTQLAVAVRNRAVEAYTEIMRMQI